jgi:ligand-binding sensor domain-containing protein
MAKEIAYTVLLIILLASCSRENAVIPVDESTESSSVLSSNVVKTFALDGEGQMWIGTSYGLNRYDGHNFTHYYNNSDTTSIPNNNILIKKPPFETLYTKHSN